MITRTQRSQPGSTAPISDKSRGSLNAGILSVCAFGEIWIIPAAIRIWAIVGAAPGRRRRRRPGAAPRIALQKSGLSLPIWIRAIVGPPPRRRSGSQCTPPPCPATRHPSAGYRWVAMTIWRHPR